MHDLLFANQERLSEDTFRELCGTLGLTDSDIRLSRSSGDPKQKIDSDFSGGDRSGVNGTPSFFLNGDRYDETTDFESLVGLMEQVLISNED
jgi:protein-disulfide isomerase